MKREGEKLVIACKPMAGVTISSVSANSPNERLFPTPSPFSFSVASTRWSSAPSVLVSCLALRFMALVFSFVSALSLSLPSSMKNGHMPASFTDQSGLLYCFVVCILVFVSSAFQLLKGVCDIAQKGFIITDRIYDYLSFILDQLVGYLLISCCSVAILASQSIEKSTSLWQITIVAIRMSFAAFLVIAICSLFSGYKLCKRIIW